ncbi:MAG TPA: TetR/AcrR family transcriptional regulator [Actinomycetota bacterium]|jgi:AcrR family transcriptional regulator|nr:TetR/AcrR family transcriptional regulator [Actinomycetota bacterium]
MADTKTGTKRRMRAPERRKQLLEVARTVFGRRGYHTVTMDDVAREAGITKPILYDHFPSKRELYRDLLESDLANLKDRLAEALETSKGNRERIRSSFQAYFDFVDDEGAGFRLLMQEAVGPEREFREMVFRFRDEVLDQVTEVIVRESRGKLDRKQAEDVALGLVGMAETAAQRDPDAPKEQRRKTVDTLVRLAWRGITGLTL